jgi:hypothetical protein
MNVIAEALIVLEALTDLCEVVENLYEGWVVVFLLAKYFQMVFFSWRCRNLLKKQQKCLYS